MTAPAQRWWCPRHHVEFTIACESCAKEGGATPEYVALGRHIHEIDWGDERSARYREAQGGET